jgi:hypothetical protein
MLALDCVLIKTVLRVVNQISFIHFFLKAAASLQNL